MRNTKTALKNLFVLSLAATLIISCDKDFISLDSDISGENNFGVDNSKYEVIAYTEKLGPVQTNNLPLNMLGIYKDPTYGSTTASFVVQLAPTTLDPRFPEETRLDSVVLTIPYFSTAKGFEDNRNTYQLDSIYGNKPFSFKLYENNYFLRTFDPNSEFDTPQKYYSNRSLSASNQIPLSALQGTTLISIDTLTTSNKEIVLKEGEEITRSTPALRLKLDSDFWQNKIISKGGSPELKNLNSFQNYFRGLYFEAKPLDNDGSLLLFNLAESNANITLHYSSPPAITDGDRITGKYIMNFSTNKINFLENDFILNIPEGNPTFGDERLYLKGGEGAMAVIKLFGGTDLDNDSGTTTEFESFKNDFVETDANGKFVKTKRLINEANLIFYVDQELTQGQEPDRIYIYDAKNKTMLIDYNYDAAEPNFPQYSRANHLGILQRESNDKNAPGVKYKIKITEHIKNLLERDSSNVALGLAVSLNVDTETNSDGTPRIQNTIQNTNNTAVNSLPVSSVISPKGTVLYGNSTSNPNKKLYLEIFYTEPNN